MKKTNNLEKNCVKLEHEAVNTIEIQRLNAKIKYLENELKEEKESVEFNRSCRKSLQKECRKLADTITAQNIISDIIINELEHLILMTTFQEDGYGFSLTDEEILKFDAIIKRRIERYQHDRKV